MYLALFHTDLIHCLDAELCTVKAKLTESLQISDYNISNLTEVRDLLKVNLTEMTKELKRLSKCERWTQDTDQKKEHGKNKSVAFGILVLQNVCNKCVVKSLTV